jgi:hypothetical protein
MARYTGPKTKMLVNLVMKQYSETISIRKEEITPGQHGNN